MLCFTPRAGVQELHTELSSVHAKMGCSSHEDIGAVLTRMQYSQGHGCSTHKDWLQDSRGLGAGLTRCCCVWGTWVQYSQGPGCSTHKDLGAVLTRTWMQYSQGLGAVLTRTWMQDSRGCRTHEVLLCVGDISAGLTRVQNSQGSHDVDDRSPFQRQQSTA